MSPWPAASGGAATAAPARGRATRAGPRPRAGARGTGRRTLVGPHVGRVMAVAFSPDGTRLVTAGEHETAKVWDAGAARVVLDLDGPSGHKGHILGAAYAADGRWIATAGADQTVRL